MSDTATGTRQDQREDEREALRALLKTLDRPVDASLSRGGYRNLSRFPPDSGRQGVIWRV